VDFGIIPINHFAIHPDFFGFVKRHLSSQVIRYTNFCKYNKSQVRKAIKKKSG
jgi:hypothetical protein